jgi:predicted nucleic acid-binding protein
VDIKLLQPGTRCFVDSNILLYHIGGSSLECKDLLKRIANEEIEAYFTTVVIAEVLHRQMLIEAVGKGVVTPGKALSKLKSNPALIGSLTGYITEVEKLLQLPFNIIEVTTADIIASHTLRRAHGLLVNDSINLACAERLALTDIATNDADFNRVTQVTVWEPTDI